jgi:DNA-binding FrmR family transcriptional regulator
MLDPGPEFDIPGPQCYTAPTPTPGGGGVLLGSWTMDEEYRQGLVNRLKSIEGHVRGIQRMVDGGSYCVDIINQSLAVQRALDKFNSLVLERHLQTCVTTAIRGDDPVERERVIEEILSVFETKSKI